MMRKSASLLVCLALGFVGCGGRPRVPTVTPRSTQITGVASGGLAMRIDIAIYNPNAYDLTVQSVSARVTAQGRDLGTVQHPYQVNLPAGSIYFILHQTDMYIHSRLLQGPGRKAKEYQHRFKAGSDKRVNAVQCFNSCK